MLHLLEGSKRFNDSLSPAEWSFQTYARPFEHGSASYRTSGKHDMVENILWAALSGKDIHLEVLQIIAEIQQILVLTERNDVEVDFESSDSHELLKLNIFFALENTTYRLNECQVNQVED